MRNEKSSLSRGYLICLSATVLWSFTGILISYLTRTYGIPSLVLAFWRDLSVSAGLIVFFLLFQRGGFRLDRSQLGFMILYGLILAVFNSMWTFSVAFNGAAVATVLAFSSPAITAVLAHWILKEPIDRFKATSILLSLTGTFLVSGAYNPALWQINPAGIIFGLLTGLLFAAYNLMGKTAANRSLNSWTSLLYSFSSATVFLLLFNLVQGLFTGTNPLSNLMWLGDSIGGWAVLILLGVGPTVGGFGLYTLSLSYLPATVSNLIASLEPALTAIMAYFLLSETLSGIQLIGGACILAGVLLLRVAGE
jgi:drug/metabolite transporter (DMT)-like permease